MRLYWEGHQEEAEVEEEQLAALPPLRMKGRAVQAEQQTVWAELLMAAEGIEMGWAQQAVSPDYFPL